MAIKITTWHPDTCGCILEYSWDDTSTEDERVHNHDKTVKVCTDHEGLHGKPAYDQVLRENQGKNKMHAHAVEHINRFGKAQGAGRAPSEDLDFTWSFTGKGANRQLEVEFKHPQGLTQSEKNMLNSHADTLGLPITVK